ncbi:MAG: hypothetical protein AB7U05_08965 [Mangrovibacterium sp.]
MNSEFFSKNFKYMVWLAALVVLVIIFFNLRKKRDDETDSEKAVDSLDVDEKQVTISDNEATIRAESLLAAMDGYGTDETAIIQNLTGLNKDDLLLIIKKYGVKPYNGAGLATRSYEIKFFSQDLNLLGWLRRELTGSALNQVKAIFENNGITF